MKEKITVIKVGGKIVEESESLGNLLDRFAQIEGRKVLIHGGGASRAVSYIDDRRNKVGWNELTVDFRPMECQVNP